MSTLGSTLSVLLGYSLNTTLSVLLGYRSDDYLDHGLKRSTLTTDQMTTPSVYPKHRSKGSTSTID